METKCYSCEEIAFINCSDCSAAEPDKRIGILCARCYDTKHKSIEFHENYELLDSNCVSNKHKYFVREDVYNNLCSTHADGPQNEFKEDCSICHFFRVHPSHSSHKNEADVVQVLGELLKKDLYIQSESMLQKVVAITSSASVLSRIADVHQKELDQKRVAIKNSEKEILSLIRIRYSNLIDEAIKAHNNSMRPLIKEKEEIAFSVSRAMAVYKDVQFAFNKDVLSFLSEIKNVKNCISQSNEDVDALLKRLTEYKVPQPNTDCNFDDSLLRKGLCELDVFFNTNELNPVEGEIRQFAPLDCDKVVKKESETVLMHLRVFGTKGEDAATYQFAFETLNKFTICFYPTNSVSFDTELRIVSHDSKVLHFYIKSEHFSIMQPFEMPFVVGLGSLQRKGDVIICTNQDRL